MSRPPRSRSLPGLERLETRALMAATITAALDGGSLTIVGTEAADQVIVRQVGTVRPAWRRASMGSGFQLEVVGVGQFPIDQVKRIVILTGAGDDVINVQLRRRNPAAIIDAGDGNDWIRGGPGRDIIAAGAGDDTVIGRGRGDQIDPGTGRNVVNGRSVIVAEPPAPAPAPAPVPPVAETPAPPPGTPWTLIPTDPPPRPDVPAWISRIYELTNAERVKAGLGTLAINPKLVQIAQIQADQMAKFGKMQHTIDGATYPDMRSRADAVGYDLEWLGENLAYNYPDPEGVIKAWMLSFNHRENMLFEPFTEMGLAITLDASGRPYVALELGRPA